MQGYVAQLGCRDPGAMKTQTWRIERSEINPQGAIICHEIVLASKRFDKRDKKIGWKR